jgi:hypothetical protein
MKSLANWLSKVPLVGEMDDSNFGFLLDDIAKDAVVRPDKILPAGHHQNGTPGRTNARVNYCDVNCSCGKGSISGQKSKCCGGDILWWYRVAEVNDTGLRIDGKNHALHRADEVVCSAKVCE